jgi:branched-chain amino acid transport system permease protein
MSAYIVWQVVLSGIMMGLIYALVAAGLSLIFGLMDMVNFAHGEFLMISMYVMFGLVMWFGLDPLVLAPLVAALMFVFGGGVYLGIGQFAHRAKKNAGMVQVFATFGLGLFLTGLAQMLFSPDYRNLPPSFVTDKTLHLLGASIPLGQFVGAAVSIGAFAVLWFLISRTDLGQALEATREDANAVALVGIDRNRVFTAGWGLGAAMVGLAGSVLATFFYIHPGVGASFSLITFVTVALGGFGSIYGALAAGLIIGLIEACTALFISPSLKAVGIYAVYLAVMFFRPRGLFGSM